MACRCDVKGMSRTALERSIPKSEDISIKDPKGEIQEYQLEEGGYYCLAVITYLRNHKIAQKQHCKTEAEMHTWCELAESRVEAVQLC